MNHAEKADTQGASKPPVPEQSHTLRATLPTRFYDKAYRKNDSIYFEFIDKIL